MIPYAVLLAGEVKLNLRSTYTCKACGAKALGDPFTVTREITDKSELTPNLTRWQTGPQHMPVEWASWLDGFTCPACNPD